MTQQQARSARAAEMVELMERLPPYKRGQLLWDPRPSGWLLDWPDRETPEQTQEAPNDLDQ